MKIRWLEDALADLEAAYDYIAIDNPQAAERIFRQIRDAVRSLAQQPNRGRPGRVPGTRELVITGTPFLLPYRIRGQAIEILRVYHGAREWPDSFT